MRDSSPIQSNVAGVRGGEAVTKGMRDGPKYPLSVGKNTHTKNVLRCCYDRDNYEETMAFNMYLRLFFICVISQDHRRKNFDEGLLKGLSGEMPDIVLVKRAPPPKITHSKVCGVV